MESWLLRDLAALYQSKESLNEYIQAIHFLFYADFFHRWR
ncbi:Uncharacterised protein [Serratia fonticola]|nr:Uncharacterised protein [Serratia fonticola]